MLTEGTAQKSTSGDNFSTPITHEEHMDIPKPTPVPCIDSTDEKIATNKNLYPDTQSTKKTPKKRNRLSAADKKAQLEAIANDFRNGHPCQAIMLRQNLTKEQCSSTLTKLFMARTITPIDPRYEVMPITTSVKNLPFLDLDGCKYVRIKYSDKGILLTPYIYKETCDE